MKQKKKINLLLGIVLIVSILVGLGRMPIVSKAVTTATVTATETNAQIIARLLALIAQLQAQLKQLIAAKNTTTIQCGWCGNSCINWAGRSNTICANVMPPANSYCQNINGTCQITGAVTKYSCSTVMGTIPSNNYSSCIPSSNGTFNSLLECENSCPVAPACITEGNSISVTPIGFTQNCCSGLTLCPPTMGLVGSRGTCQKSCAVSIPTVFISGSTYPTINQSNTYIANVTGGVFPYSFIWSIDGLVSSYPDSNVGNYKWTQSGSHTINVKVTDSKGVTGTGSLTITINTNTCADSDGSQNMFIKGIVQEGAYMYTDSCLSDTTVNEFYCLNGQSLSININCATGYTCTDGACKQTPLATIPISTITCTDTDGGDAMYQKGTITIRTAADGAWNYTDYCQSSTLLQEYSCLSNFGNYLDSNAMSAYVISGHICETGSTCYDGACKIMGSYLRPPCGNYGDVDLDGYITSSDTEIIANYPAFSSQLTAEQKARANVNLDGVVDYLDASIVNQYISKSISTFPLCPNVKGAETHIFDTNLSYGMENEDVRELQSILALKGYFKGIVSGYFGWQTNEAVKAFQLANNLPATGFVGSLTRELLNN